MQLEADIFGGALWPPLQYRLLPVIGTDCWVQNRLQADSRVCLPLPPPREVPMVKGSLGNPAVGQARNMTPRKELEATT